MNVDITMNNHAVAIDANAHPEVARTFEKLRGFKRKDMDCGHGSFVHSPNLEPFEIPDMWCAACRERAKQQREELAEADLAETREKMRLAWESGRGIAVRVKSGHKSVYTGFWNSNVATIVHYESAETHGLSLSLTRLHLEDLDKRTWTTVVPTELLTSQLPISITAALMPDNPTLARKLPKATKPAKAKALKAGKVVAVVPKRGTKTKQLPSRTKVS